MRGKLGDVTTSFLLDTGATESFVSPRLYERIASLANPFLIPPDRTFRQADGTELSVMGKVKLQIVLGGCRVEHMMWVAKVSDQAILGLDFLREHKCTLLWEDENLQVDKYRVPVQSSAGEPISCRV